tara:strand:+ start:435 stop:710 length:276 start_codon:yes stop_codon:yes gene_type:complete
MSALINFSIDVKKLPTQNFKEVNGKIWLNLTMAVNDTSKFGQNAAIYVAQSKEEREAKKSRFYLGNGSVIWTDNKICLATKDEPVVEDTPF